MARRTSLLLAVTLIAPLSLAAQDVMGGAGRELGGHRFVPSIVVPSPFIASRFTATTAFGGVRDLDVPIYNVEDSLVQTVTGDLGYLTLDFEYQQRVNAWLALRGGVGALARSGTDGFAMLAEGISAVYGYSLGAQARLLGNDRMYLSAALDYVSSSVFGYAPLTFVQGVGAEIRRVVDSIEASGTPIDSTVIRDVLKNLDLSAYSAVEQGSVARTTAGLRAAFAIAPWLGLTAVAQTGIGEVLNGASDLGVIDLGATASVDLGVLTRFPIGLALSARRQSLNERASDVAKGVTAFGLFISYAARRDLALGLDLTSAQFSQRSTANILTGSRGAVTITYYF